MKQLFKNLGANEKEMNTYLKLLELGAQPISILAKHMHTARSSMYVTIEKLQSLQLIEEFERAGIKYVKAVSPEGLHALLKAKENRIQQTYALLEQHKEDLQQMESSLSITPKVQYFEGKEKVMKLYETIYTEKEYVGFFNAEIAVQTLGKSYLKIAEIATRNKTSGKDIVVYNPEALVFQKKYSSEYHQIKILPKGITFDADVIIAAESIYMIAFQENTTSGIEIHNKTLADAMRIAFEGWWKSLKEP